MNNCCKCDFDLEVAYKNPAYLIVNYTDETSGEMVYGRLLVNNQGEDQRLVVPVDKLLKTLVPLIFTNKEGKKFIGLDTKNNKFLGTYIYDTLPNWFLLGYEVNGERFPFVFSNWGNTSKTVNFNYRLLNPINREPDEFDNTKYNIKIKTLDELPHIANVSEENDYVIIKRGRFLKKIKFRNFLYYFSSYTADGF